MSSEWVAVAGRRVKICTGRKSQSINICHKDSPREGSYQYCYKTSETDRLSAYDLELQVFDQIDELRNFLVSRGYEDKTGRESRRPKPEPIKPVLEWGESQRAKIDDAVKKLIVRFQENPYRHRVEHSLHCELFQLLEKDDAICNGRIAIDGGRETGLVHKEWPETRVRDQKVGRGNFDLAVLTPPRADQVVDRETFLGGHIKPYAAFELGLDYELDHFLNDVAKLRHSQIEAGYVIHFARAHAANQDQVEDCVKDFVDRGRDGKDGWPNLVVVILKDGGGHFEKGLG